MIFRPDNIIVKTHIRIGDGICELYLHPDWDGRLWSFYGEFETHATDELKIGQELPLIESLDVKGSVIVLHYEDNVATNVKRVKVKVLRVKWVSDYLRKALGNPEGELDYHES